MNLQLSTTYAANLSAMVGQGLIVGVDPAEKFDKDIIPCSVGCERGAASHGHDYTQVFAVIKHPVHGMIAVSPSEYEALGLPQYSYRFSEQGAPQFFVVGETPLTLSRALANYPAFRADLKKALLAALTDEAAGTGLASSDNIISVLYELAAAEPLARELLENAGEAAPAAWLFNSDGEITQETIIAASNKLADVRFSDHPERDSILRGVWETRINAAALFFVVM